MENNISECSLNEEWYEVIGTEIESVLKQLSESWPSSLQVYNFIKECLEWSDRCDNTTTKVFCNSKWKGSVISTVKGSDYAVAIYTQHKNFSHIASAFEEKSVVNWSDGPLIFCALALDVCQVLEKNFLSCNRRIINISSFTAFWISAEDARAVEVTCPEDMYFSKLEDIHASTVNSNWPYANEKSIDLIRDLIKLKDTVGLFTKKGSKLVSWVLNTFYGIGMLHTIDEYRRKGYGTLVMKKLIESLGKTGKNPTLLTLTDNIAAKSLFLNIGFSEIETYKSMKVT